MGFWKNPRRKDQSDVDTAKKMVKHCVGKAKKRRAPDRRETVLCGQGWKERRVGPSESGVGDMFWSDDLF